MALKQINDELIEQRVFILDRIEYVFLRRLHLDNTIFYSVFFFGFSNFNQHKTARVFLDGF